MQAANYNNSKKSEDGGLETKLLIHNWNQSMIHPWVEILDSYISDMLLISRYRQCNMWFF